MARTARLHGYAALWRIPGASVLLVFGFLGRLGISLEPLGLILLIRETTGRYAAAALAGAVYTLAYAGAQPLAGRLVDRLGPPATLLVTAAIHPVGLIALIVAARGDGRPLAVTVLAAALSGATYPPLIAVLRSAWISMTEPDDARAGLRGTALAADTALYQSVFVIGPLLVAGLMAAGSASLVLAASAVAAGLGTVALARGRAMRAMPSRQAAGPRGGPSPLRVPGFPAVLVCSAGLGATFGVVTVAVPAFVTGHHASSALAGILLAILGIGSVLGGVAFGATRIRVGLPRQFAALLAAVGISFAVYAVMPRPAALAVALFFGGALVAPVLTVESALVGRIVPAASRTRAYTWVVGVEVTATAAGLQAAGLVADGSRGLTWAFLAASAAVVPAVVLAALPSGPIARAAGPPAAVPRRLDQNAGPHDSDTDQWPASRSDVPRMP
jgi:MFS family permease